LKDRGTQPNLEWSSEKRTG